MTTNEAVLTVIPTDSTDDMGGVYVDTRRWKVSASEGDSPRKQIVERFLSRPENRKELSRHRQRIGAVKAELARDRTSASPGSKPRTTAGGPSRNAPAHKVGRNDPCPCGSGKKHKRCCGR